MHTDPCTHSCSRAASAARRRVCTALAPGCNTRARMLRREYLCTAAHAGAHKDAFVTQPLRRVGGERARHARTSEQSSSSSVSVTALPRPDQARGAGGSPAPSQGPPVRCARMRAVRTHACVHASKDTCLCARLRARWPGILHTCQHTPGMHACMHLACQYLRSPRRDTRESAPRTGFRPRPHCRRRWTLAGRSSPLCVLTVSLLTASGTK